MQPVHQQDSAPAVRRNRHRNVLPSEDVALYDELRDYLETRYTPETILEELEIEHLLNTLWEIQRLVRIKPQVINIDRKRALTELIQQTLFDHRLARVEDIEKAGELARAYFGTQEEREKVEELLAPFGLSADAVNAKAFVLNAPTLESIETQIQLATERAYAIRGQLEMMAQLKAQLQNKPRSLTDKRSRSGK